MMQFKYYPGCSLKGISSEYDYATKAVCSLLGIELEELSDWVCCGGGVTKNTDEYLSMNLPAMNFTHLKGEEPTKMLTPCPACYQKLKVVGEQEGVNVNHLAHVLCEEELVDKIKSKLTHPLKGLKTVCYYGCLLARGADLGQELHVEDPEEMDRLLSILGVDNKFWSWKTECCGAHMAITHPDSAERLCTTLLRMAQEAGAEAIVTACPMCQFNLDVIQRRSAQWDKLQTLPVFFLPELIGLALGHPGFSGWMERHMIDPIPLLRSKGLL